MTLDTISIPTEVVLWRSTAGSTTTKCLDLHAGGNLAFFTVERNDGSGIPTIDLLACGNGQYGGLGNAMYSSAQGVPVRTRGVSGLLECECTSLLSFCSGCADVVVCVDRFGSDE